MGGSSSKLKNQNVDTNIQLTTNEDIIALGKYLNGHPSLEEIRLCTNEDSNCNTKIALQLLLNYSRNHHQSVEYFLNDDKITSIPDEILKLNRAILDELNMAHQYNAKSSYEYITVSNNSVKNFIKVQENKKVKLCFGKDYRLAEYIIYFSPENKAVTSIEMPEIDIPFVAMIQKSFPNLKKISLNISGEEIDLNISKDDYIKQIKHHLPNVEVKIKDLSKGSLVFSNVTNNLSPKSSGNSSPISEYSQSNSSESLLY